MLNYADINGGAIANASGSSPTITYCTFSGNTAMINGPAIRIFNGGDINISRSILWNNGFGTGVLTLIFYFLD